MTNQTAHTVVIGAGIIGCSIAYHLAKQGANVTLLDSQEPGQSTTAVSFAWLNGRDKNPRHYHDLNRRSLDHWPRFAKQLNAESALTRGGELRWATTEEEAEDIVQRVRTLQSWGYPIYLRDADEIKNLEPNLITDNFVVASHTEMDGHVETSAVVKACIQYLEQHNTILYKTEVIGFIRTDHKIQAVVTTAGEITCDTIVIAAGPDTAHVAQLANIHVPMYDTFGCTILTEPIAPIFQNVAVIHSPRDTPPQTNFRQLPNGSVMMHGGAHGRVFDGGSLGQNDKEIQTVHNTVAQYMPALKDVPIQEVRQGRRPIPKDGHPIIGFTKQIPNLYLSVMHSGVTLAPLVGECAAIEILEQIHIDYLEPYRFSRFES